MNTGLDIGYLAGLFDGEGCIHVPHLRNPKTPNQSPTYGVRVIFSICNEEVIRRIAEHTGTKYCRINKSKTNILWRDAFTVAICGERATSLLKLMMPFLIVKREEALLAIKLQDHITQYRNMWKRITREQKDALMLYREGLRLQIRALKRTDAIDRMVTNSVELQCPASDGAEGQYRAKQGLKSVA